MQWLKWHYFWLLRSHRPLKEAIVLRSDRRCQSQLAESAAKIRRQIPAYFCNDFFPGADIPVREGDYADVPVWGLVVMAAACADWRHRAFYCGYKSHLLGEYIGYTSGSPA